MKTVFKTSVFVGIFFLLVTWCLCQAANATPVISVAPKSVNVGNIPVGDTSSLKTVTVINKGTSDLSIDSITIAGTNASEFSQIIDCITMLVGSSCTVTITFTPAIPYGKKSAVMSIASNDPKKPTINVKLSGQAPPPNISASAMSVNLGSIPVGSSSLAKIVTVKNTGISDLMIGSFTITGTNAPEFSQINDCSTLPAKGLCTVSVAFAPTSAFGKKSAIMSIASNDPKKPIVNVKLTGQAPPPKISVSPKSINFGHLPVGNTSQPKIVKIKNTGISDLAVSSIALTGANANEFAQTNDCSVLRNGDECAISATFNPKSSGNKSALVSITSNDPKNSVNNISLFGTTDGSAATQSIAGLWMGGFSSNIFHRTYNVIGIITESGIARFAAPSAWAQYSGVVHVSGNHFSSSTEAYGSEGIYIGIVKITGTFTPQGIMNGTYSGVGDHGTFSLAYNALYERPSALAKIAGNWTDYSSDYYQTVTVDMNGNIAGEPFGGCSYSGNVGIINSMYNVYNASLTIFNCGAKNGFYTGLGTLTDTDADNDTILAIVSNSTHSWIIELRR